MSNNKTGFLIFNLIIFVLFGIAALIMLPVSLKRGENWMAVFWCLQFIAMATAFAKTYRSLRQTSKGFKDK
ncbi:hypothetical protein AMJ80_00885 [bacterium SM23_31]|nr:MAG: hypothetical protein AMJ80_00885 [bacterium SM23_31]